MLPLTVRLTASVGRVATRISCRRCLLNLLLLLLLLPMYLLLLPQPLTAQSPRVYRDRVQPNWFQNNQQFWYRVSTGASSWEFVVVDAMAGVRAPAFDHDMVASQMSAILEKQVSADQLPISTLDFPASATVDGRLNLTGREGRFVFDPVTGSLTRDSQAPGSQEPTLFLPPQPSGSSAVDTEIIVINELSEPISMLWIDGQLNGRSYGQVAPGATRSQHTFVSHVWLFQRSDGSAIGCVAAEAGAMEVRLNASAAANVRQHSGRENQRRGGRGGARRTDRTANNPSSPDGQYRAFVRDHNLWLQHNAQASEDQADEPAGDVEEPGSDVGAVGSGAVEVQLTSDADASCTFRRDASRARLIHMNYDRGDYPDHIADVHWSPDSRFLAAMQTTQVDERRVSYIESTPSDQLQPKLHSYPYLKPGDPIPRARPRLFRVDDGTEIPISSELFPDPWSLTVERWSDDGTRFWMLYNERGHQQLRVLEVVAATGDVHPVVDEHSQTFIHYSSEGKMELRWLNDGTLLWASERSGWNHLYRYSLESRSLQHPVTQGSWNVRRVDWLDQEREQLWFTAVGIRSEQDPYHQHFCRVNLDGSGLIVLTEGDGTHDIEWSPDRQWFIDRWSRADLPPVTELRSAKDGRLICLLESANADEMLTARGRFPERFMAKGRDNQTEIWGLIHRPADFDPAARYPVIECIYAGPHSHHVPKNFLTNNRCQSLADHGFIVVQIDGMGTAWRSKSFHDVCWRNLKDAGFPDRIAWIRAAASQYPQLDLNRVGIYGGSAGGQNAMAALLWHHDFYRAAVADCGCHDNRMDKIWWNEQWMGVPDGDHYAASSNTQNAGLLQGKLMLVVGELDRNVDPATTTQVARRLIEADKDFDFVVIPGAGHGACETPWGSRRRLKFFMDAFQQAN